MSSKVASSFEDRGEARLILDLETAIANSPKFDLNLFRSSLESKDMYGNEQVSRQHVVQAANNSQLSVPKDIFKRWMMASDPINRGIYRIPKLVDFLQRSQPNVIKRVKTANMSGHALSKSHGHLSCKFLRNMFLTFPTYFFPSNGWVIDHSGQVFPMHFAPG